MQTTGAAASTTRFITVVKYSVTPAQMMGKSVRSLKRIRQLMTPGTAKSMLACRLLMMELSLAGWCSPTDAMMCIFCRPHLGSRRK